ncbi:MAG: two-component system response regulator [Candidatus Omnitrophica bacterium CG11_big_fil_rev_8_21_14_0_20_45_26]|uniref:Two-component system response regulator n=1 Tax=Candidatus Abzuiibacterium crystallinum TaxID=1974748 RepID=A0A2H0LP42_9BACT|nr:MAG: two-component system response regulator [Candidatus Omnitrophica bacterium CG11_big_fil_rev_8_21_14_0_20_45_26]PIW64086.1 MAG: two-component system response regulator [Candidatus Omnitrophica bacterium CG12_big_fil_rev_8_21_14_0_65_45_16]
MAKKILIADDEPFILKMVTARLQKEGFEVVTAQDGQSVLDLTRQQNPDLILLDIMMPKLDGYKVCRLLKFDKQFSHIPVVMCTARDMDEDSQLGFQTGADEYVTKPFEMEELVKVIHDTIEKSKSNSA